MGISGLFYYCNSSAVICSSGNCTNHFAVDKNRLLEDGVFLKAIMDFFG